MIEYLNCDSCTAIVSTDMNTCDYCGNDFKHRGVAAEILKVRDDLDKKWMFKEGISYVIPYTKRGKKIIENWDEALQAAINMSKDLS
jgi:hypothetical protein